MPEFTATFSIAVDHPCLAGHFPGRPVVPAVLLLQSVTEALRAPLASRALRGVTAAKFLRPVLPGQTVTLRAHSDAEATRVRFRCDVAGAAVAQGELHYAVMP